MSSDQREAIERTLLPHLGELVAQLSDQTSTSASCGAALGTAAARTDTAGNLAPNKRRATPRIDGTALVMGLAMAPTAQAKPIQIEALIGRRSSVGGNSMPFAGLIQAGHPRYADSSIRS
jgi:hypothetical protein